MTEAVMITASVMKELINQVLINVELLDNIRQYLGQLGYIQEWPLMRTSVIY